MGTVLLLITGLGVAAGLFWLARTHAERRRESSPEELGYRARVAPPARAVSTAFAATAQRLNLRHIETSTSQVVRGQVNGLFVTVDQLNRDMGAPQQDVTRVTVESAGKLPVDFALGTEATLVSAMQERGVDPPADVIILDHNPGQAALWAEALSEGGPRASQKLLLLWGEQIGVALCQGQLVLEMIGTATESEVLTAMIRDAAQLCRDAASNLAGVPAWLASRVADSLAARRLHALQILIRRFPDNTELQTALSVARVDPDAHLRLEAALCDGPGGVPALIDVLGSDDTAVQVDAANALADVGTVEAVEPLMRLRDRASILQTQLRGACEQAIARIQERLRGAAPGQLSVAAVQDESGGLALTEEPKP